MIFLSSLFPFLSLASTWVLFHLLSSLNIKIDFQGHGLQSYGV